MIHLLLLLAVGVGQQEAPIGKSAPVSLMQPAPLKCEKYEHEILPRGMHNCRAVAKDSNLIQCDEDAPICAPIMHPLKESEYQEIMERLKWIDHIRAEQCPSLSWINGKCLPYCDEFPGSTGSCAHRNKPSPER